MSGTVVLPEWDSFPLGEGIGSVWTRLFLLAGCDGGSS